MGASGKEMGRDEKDMLGNRRKSTPYEEISIALYR
jgi:hypothetical protein